MIAEVYKELAARIKELGNGETIKWVDLYNAQPEFLGERLAHDFPAVFIEFAQIDWTSMATPLQRGEAILRLHIVQWSVADTYQGSEQQNDALQRLQLLSTLHGQLQGWAGTYHTGLMRTATLSDTRHDAVTVDVMEYRCSIYECPEKPELAAQEVMAELRISGEFHSIGSRPAASQEEPPYDIPMGG